MTFWNKQKPKTYILVKEGHYGIETFVDKDITRFNPAYKDQLISFLDKVSDQLKASKKRYREYDDEPRTKEERHPDDRR